jgi:hypothetical protein
MTYRIFHFNGLSAAFLTIAALGLLSAPAYAQQFPYFCDRTLLPNQVGASDIYGPGIGQDPLAPITCTIQVEVPLRSKYILFGVQQIYSYWLHPDQICGKFPCPQADVKMVLSGPSGVIHTFSSSGSAATPPTGSGWMPYNQVSVCLGPSCSVCADNPTGATCANFPDLGTQTYISVLQTIGSVFYDTEALARNSSVALTWTFTLKGDNGFSPIQYSWAFDGANNFEISPNIDANSSGPVSPQYSFRPADSRDPATTSGCDQNPGNCHPQIFVQTPFINQLFASDTPLPATVAFTLEAPAYMQGNWLPGSSTNWGSDPAAYPDYIFEASQNPGFQSPSADGLSIVAVSSFAPFAIFPRNLVVTSRDYGGTANLRAALTISGHTYEADPANPTQENGFLATPACAGKGLFLQMPIDQDCNGIADWWEGQYTTPVGGHLDAKADNDGGAGKPGDGFSNFDEYRGFHYVTDDWQEPGAQQPPDASKIKWASTDPTQKDIFFWDTSSDGRFTTALRSVLGVQAPFNYWRVSQAQANPTGSDPRNGDDPTKPMAGHLNFNSPFTAKVFAYPLVYVDPGAALYPAAKGACGVLATAQTLNDDGVPILVYDAQIPGCAASAHGFPVDVLRAGIIAHETGHKFGLEHYQSVAQWTNAISYPAAGLTFLQYILYLASPEPAGVAVNTLSRYNTYASWAGLVTGDGAVPLHDIDGNATVGSAKVAGAIGAFDSILQYGWARTITPKLGMIVNRQFGYIMDWSPRLLQAQPVVAGPNLLDPGGWLFWPGPGARPGQPANALPDADLPKVCVKPACQ